MLRMSATPSGTDPSRSQRPSVAVRVHPALPPLVMGAGVVVQQLMDTPIAAIPLCAPWFAGVARHSGQIVPFFDLARWAKVERRDDQPTLMLSVATGTSVIGLLASESPTVVPSGRTIVPWAGKDQWLALGADADVFCLFDPPAWLEQISTTVADEGG